NGLPTGGHVGGKGGSRQQQGQNGEIPHGKPPSFGATRIEGACNMRYITASTHFDSRRMWRPAVNLAGDVSTSGTVRAVPVPHRSRERRRGGRRAARVRGIHGHLEPLAEVVGGDAVVDLRAILLDRVAARSPAVAADPLEGEGRGRDRIPA